jgi:SOS-response transcriptional repressor LexA
MTKTMHSTSSRPAEAAPNFTDPTTLPDEYAMRVRGDCLAPAIKAGDAVLFDQRQSYKPGDLVGVYLRPAAMGAAPTSASSASCST